MTNNDGVGGRQDVTGPFDGAGPHGGKAARLQGSTTPGAVPAPRWTGGGGAGLILPGGDGFNPRPDIVNDGGDGGTNTDILTIVNNIFANMLGLNALHSGSGGGGYVNEVGGRGGDTYIWTSTRTMRPRGISVQGARTTNAGAGAAGNIIIIAFSTLDMLRGEVIDVSGGRAGALGGNGADGVVIVITMADQGIMNVRPANALHRFRLQQYRQPQQYSQQLVDGQYQYVVTPRYSGSFVEN